MHVDIHGEGSLVVSEVKRIYVVQEIGKYQKHDLS